MKKGDKVNVYYDPITMNSLEGEATLVKLVWAQSGDSIERWHVKFPDGDVVMRTIRTVTNGRKND